MLWLICLSLTSVPVPLDGLPLPRIKPFVGVSEELLSSTLTIPVGKDDEENSFTLPIDVANPPFYSKRISNVQDIVLQRDAEKRRHPSFSAYFAEILVGCLVAIAFAVFLCWWNCTKHGQMVDRNGQGNEGFRVNVHPRQRMWLASKGIGQNSLQPELPVIHPPVKPLQKCPKPSCVCDTGKCMDNNKRKRQEYNESYRPVNIV